MAQTQITSFIMVKVVLTIAPLEWHVTMHILFDRNTEWENHLELSDYLNQF